MADNIRLDLAGVCTLETAVGIALGKYKGEALGYREDDKRLVIFWALPEGVTRFPAPMKVAAVSSLVQAWLDHAPYPKKPDIDGDVEKGWRVYVEQWGHVNGEWAAAFGVEPYWLMYGK